MKEKSAQISSSLQAIFCDKKFQETNTVEYISWQEVRRTYSSKTVLAILSWAVGQ